MKIKKNDLSYWRWFFVGLESKRAGIKSYFNVWLLLHAAIAFILTNYVTIDQDKAIALSVPFMGILIAITVAWCGNIVTLLNSEDIVNLSEYYHGGMEGYAFSVQSTVLMLFIAIISWTLYGFKVFTTPLFSFFMSSLVIRDCWQVILFAQMLTVVRARIALHNKNKQDVKGASTRSPDSLPLE